MVFKASVFGGIISNAYVGQAASVAFNVFASQTTYLLTRVALVNFGKHALWGSWTAGDLLSLRLNIATLFLSDLCPSNSKLRRSLFLTGISQLASTAVTKCVTHFQHLHSMKCFFSSHSLSSSRLTINLEGCHQVPVLMIWNPERKERLSVTIPGANNRHTTVLQDADGNTHPLFVYYRIQSDEEETEAKQSIAHYLAFLQKNGSLPPDVAAYTMKRSAEDDFIDAIHVEILERNFTVA